ncbi:MAG: 1-acyl-sn-glycerol-3-phosphate acyltransferase [Rhodothermales bacterium]
MRHSLQRQLSGVFASGCPVLDPAAVTAFVCNHSGRWDGFAVWAERFKVRKPGKHLSIVLEESHERYWIFRGAGAVPISPGSISSVRNVTRVLRDALRPGDTLALFPQGRIFPGDKLPLGFKSLTRVLSHIAGPVMVIPTALATEMLHLKKPAVFMSFGSPVPFASLGHHVHDVEALVTGQVVSLRSRLNALGENAPIQFENE